MASLMFPNSSYLVVFSRIGEVSSLAQKTAARQQIRVHVCSDLAEFKSAMEILQKKLGCFLFLDEFSKDEQLSALALTKQMQIPARVFSSESSSLLGWENAFYEFKPAKREEVLAQAFASFMQGLIPKDLAKIGLHAANMIFPVFFPNIGAFKEMTPAQPEFDLQINYFTVAGDLIGLCTLRANLLKAKQAWPAMSEDQAIGNLKEAVNQFLGVISQNLAKLGITAKIGLPTTFTLFTIPEIQTLVSFPSTYFFDPNEIFQLSLGYADLENRPLFDFTSIDPAAGSGDEVEFL